MSDWYDHEFGKISGRHNVHNHKKAREHLANAVNKNGHPNVGGGTIYMHEFKEDGLPESIDWRDYGAVTEAVAQGSCGSCWAFTTAAMVESANKISGGSLLRLSPQQLLDCASNDSTGNMGCDGGHPIWTYPWLFSNKLIQWSEYPYEE